MDLKFLPTFLVRIKKQFGKDQYEQFLNALNQKPPVSIRVNPNKILAVNPPLKQVEWCQNGFTLNERPVFTIDPWFQAGAYYVQEAGSMFLEYILSYIYRYSFPEKVLDLCAAPGGKTTLMASFFPDTTLIVANETIKKRAEILVDNIDRWGADNVVVTNNDPKHFSDFRGFFDFCLIDAPCSGEGLFRKEPEAIKQWNLANTNFCAMRQRRILMDIWNSISENGIIVYSTCTYNPAENEENLQWLASQKEIEFINIPFDESWGIDVIDYNGVRGYLFLPHKVESEGFFISVFRKKSEVKPFITEPFIKGKLYQIPRKLVDNTKKYTLKGNPFMTRGHIFNTTADNKLINLLGNKLNIFRYGCKIASVFRDEMKPEHSTVLSSNFNIEEWEKIELNYEQVCKFYRKDNFEIPDKEKGRYVLTWNELPIGIANVFKNRINTSFPLEQRILMDFPKYETRILDEGFVIKKVY